MKGLITSHDFLVLRDGRPFGADMNASGYDWPKPQTVAGMIRTTLGEAQGPDFFVGPDKEENIAKILNVSITKQLPYVKEKDNEWEPLFPIPADLEFRVIESNQPKIENGTEKSVMLQVNKLSYYKTDLNEGTDIVNRDWLVCISNQEEKVKPPSVIPRWLFTSFLMRYINDECISEFFKPYDIGLPGPICEKRVHNGIEPDSFSAQDGKLFSNYGFYFNINLKKEKRSYQLAIGFNADTAGFDLIPTGDSFLGGERRVVTVDNYDISYPVRPNCFENQTFLKIILVTHGDFGGWCPQWLCPDLDSNTIDWVSYPGSDIMLRLRSAAVKGWDSVSGWDYKNKRPKAMKKLVKPGTVYMVELKKPSDSDRLSSMLWGNTLAGGPEQSEFDGYNQVITALYKPDAKKD